MEQMLFNSLNWAENTSAWLGKSYRSKPAGILNQAFFLLVAEAFTYLAMAYHAVCLTTKALPMTARHILLHIPHLKVQQLGKKIPEGFTWDNVKKTHMNPLKQSLTFSPLLRSFTQSPRDNFSDMQKQLLHHSQSAERGRIWNIITSRSFLFTLCTVAAIWVVRQNLENYRLRSECESGGDEWVNWSMLTGDGFCSNEAQEARKRAECENGDGDWKTYKWEFNRGIERRWGRCDYSRRDCEQKGNFWSSRFFTGLGTCDSSIEGKKKACLQRGLKWVSSFPWITGSCSNPRDCPAAESYPKIIKACPSQNPKAHQIFGTTEKVEVRKKLRELAKTLHPDKTPLYPDCEFYWQCISDAAARIQ